MLLRFRNNVEPYKIIPYEEELELISEYQTTTIHSKKKLIMDRLLKSYHNLIVRLILKATVVNKVIRDDMYQEACIGFMRAVDKFDTINNKYLTTYATMWIKAKITEEWRRIEVKRSHIVTESDMSSDNIEEIDTNWINKFSSDVDVEKHVHHKLVVDKLDKIIDATAGNKAKMIKLRHLNLDDKPTLEETGQIYNISKQRVKQIEDKIMPRILKTCEDLKLNL